MAARKRPAAALDAGHATTTQGSASCSSKRSRGTSIGSTDDYDEPSCLGEGAFGAVYKARHCVTGKTVPIKWLPPPNDDAELLREARFLETCSGNPHVVALEGLVRVPTTGELCIAMEYRVAVSTSNWLPSDTEVNQHELQIQVSISTQLF